MAPVYPAFAKEVVWTVDWHGDIGTCSSCWRNFYSRMAFLRQPTLWDGVFLTRHHLNLCCMYVVCCLHVVCMLFVCCLSVWCLQIKCLWMLLFVIIDVNTMTMVVIPSQCIQHALSRIQLSVSSPELIVISDGGLSTIDFENVSVGHSVVRTVTIQNISGRMIEVQNYKKKPKNDTDWQRVALHLFQLISLKSGVILVVGLEKF